MAMLLNAQIDTTRSIRKKCRSATAKSLKKRFTPDYHGMKHSKLSIDAPLFLLLLRANAASRRLLKLMLWLVFAKKL
ncbi:hypothetical protein AAFN90_01445 [Erwiniaceae bacterium CAU 1747]